MDPPRTPETRKGVTRRRNRYRVSTMKRTFRVRPPSWTTTSACNCWYFMDLPRTPCLAQATIPTEKGAKQPNRGDPSRTKTWTLRVHEMDLPRTLTGPSAYFHRTFRVLLNRKQEIQENTGEQVNSKWSRDGNVNRSDKSSKVSTAKSISSGKEDLSCCTTIDALEPRSALRRASWAIRTPQ
jgi:hypothetical protein